MTVLRQAAGGRLRRPFLALLLLLASTTCAAQTIDPRDGRYALNEDGTVPPWVVPVLRLVSSTHVEPTTGLVLTDGGLVLVPMGFAAEGDEVIVLDGGTDIVRHGRPAHLKDYFPAEGLQILSVPGLKRSPAPFSNEALADGARVELTAFPPAERIAEGDPPLHAPATLVVFGADNAPAVSGESPLPNVTGPLLDACGNVVAYSLAHDVQTMSSHPGTRYKWRDTLLAIFNRIGARPAPSACRAEEPAAPEPETQPETAPAETGAAEPEPVEETSAPEGEADEATVEVAEPAPEETATSEQAEAEPFELERLPPFETDLPVLPEPEAEPRAAWPWLLPALALIAAGLGLHWRRRRGARTAALSEAEPGDDNDATGSDAAAPAPKLDRRLVLRGILADGTPLEAEVAVSSRAINVVVGRAATADLVLPGAAVSRRHVRLNGSCEALTVSDLGSANGTSVNGVPCLEGEILYLGPGDVLVLGDAQLSVHFETPGGEPA